MVYILLGLGTFLLAFYVQGGQAAGTDTWEQNFYIASGAGIMGAGIGMIVRNIKLLKDDKSRKARELVEYDERNLHLRNKAMNISGILLGLFLYIGTLVSGAVNKTVSQTLMVVLCVFLLLVFTVKLILRKVS